MTEASAVKKAAATVKTILAKREAELNTLAEQIDRETAAIVKAREDMEAATAAGDVKAYQLAKNARRDAEDAKEMYESRINTLNEKPLISQSEYEKTVANIYAEIAALDGKTKEKLASLSDQMNDEAEKLKQVQEEANKVLRQLQHDLYRDADRTGPRGILLADKLKAVDKWDTINWGKAGVTHYQYSQYTGRRVE